MTQANKQELETWSRLAQGERILQGCSARGKASRIQRGTYMYTNVILNSFEKIKKERSTFQLI